MMYTEDPRWEKFQKNVVGRVLGALDENKFVLLSAPTGTGKSVIGVVAASKIGTTYITSPQVILVDQYEKAFGREMKDMGRVIKGLVHYKCAFGADNAADAPCHDKKFVFIGKDGNPSKVCPHVEECEYLLARDEARKAGITISTLHYFMLPIRYSLLDDEEFQEVSTEEDKPSRWGKRKMLIVDEAHNLPEVLIDFFTIRFTSRIFGKKLYNHLRRMAKKHELSKQELIDFFKDAKVIIEKDAEIARRVAKNMQEDAAPVSFETSEGTQNMPRSKVLGFVRKQQQRLDDLHKYTSSLKMVPKWVFSSDESKEGLYWQPYEIREMIYPVFEKFDKVLLMSATMLNPGYFAARLGITDFKFLDVGTDFNPENGRVYLSSAGWINKNLTDKSKMSFVHKIDSIARRYANFKGVIHAHTYAWQKFISEHSSFDVASRFILHSSEDRSETVKKFKEATYPAILLSVNMAEGLDLPGDDARWQIIVKSPLPYYGDPWVKAHRENDPQWHDTYVLTKIVQACGRIVRNNTDWGYTYILDGNAINIIEKNLQTLPAWFLARLGKGYVTEVKK